MTGKDEGRKTEDERKKTEDRRIGGCFLSKNIYIIPSLIVSFAPGKIRGLFFNADANFLILF